MTMTLNPNILGQLLEMKAGKDPDKVVLTFENGDYPAETQTYRQLHENSHKLAEALAEAGVGLGDRFAVMTRNHPEIVHAMSAATILGAVMTPVDPRSKGSKLAHQLNNSESKALIISADLLENFERARPDIHGLENVWVCEKPGFPATSDPSIYKPLDELWERPFRPVDYGNHNPLHPWQIVYTSGTTGDPKGVVCETMRLSFYAFLGNFFGYNDDDILYTGLSLTHGNAQAVTFSSAVNRGIPAVFSVKFTKSRLWDITRRFGVTTFSLLGGMMSGIYNEPPRPDDRDNPVHMVVSAGTPRAIWEAFEERFGLQILEWYAAVEGGFAYKPVGQGPVGSFGKPVEMIMEMRVVDEADNPCPPGVPGELVTRPKRGDAKVRYFKNEKASADKTRGGWLRSGDICHVDEEGWFYFDYRKGGGLRRAGDFIQPSFVEKVIGEHPSVSEAVVFGTPSAGGAPGESDIVAAVKPFDGKGIDPASLFNACRRGLEPNSVPSYIMVVDDIPKTITEKPQARFLKQLFETRPENIYKSEDFPK